MLFKKILLFVSALAFIGVCSGFCYYANIQKMSARMITRTAQKGTTTTIRADVYYQSSGKMTTHFFEPIEYFVINNAKGEISMYDPKLNTVKQQQGYMYSTETTQLYFFLQNKKSDLGLKAMGFSINGTRFEEDLMITNWVAPAHMRKLLKEVELVHRGPNPIYMKYVDKDGKSAKKVYYYNYATFNGTDFPLAVTQIDYLGKDSVITKINYTDVKVNESAVHALFDYNIPANAKISK